MIFSVRYLILSLTVEAKSEWYLKISWLAETRFDEGVAETDVGVGDLGKVRVSCGTTTTIDESVDDGGDSDGRSMLEPDRDGNGRGDEMSATSGELRVLSNFEYEIS